MVKGIRKFYSIEYYPNKNVERGKRLKKGINEHVFPKEWTNSFSLKAAKKAGYEGIEFMVEEKEGYGFLHFNSTYSQAKVLARQCRELGLDIPTLSTVFHNVYSLTNGDPNLRKRGEDICLKMIELGAVMGAKVIQIVPGVASPDVEYDYAYELAQESLSRLAPEASQAGIIMGVENVNTRFLPSPLEFVRFLDEIDHPSVQAYFNIGNAMDTGFAEHWIPILGSRIVAIHTKDYKIHDRTFTPALVGDANWPVIMKSLREMNYTGYMMSVIPAGYSDYWKQPVAKTYQNLISILEL